MANTNINIIFQNGQSGGTPTEPEVPGATPNPDAPELTARNNREKNNALTTTKAIAFAVGKQSLSAVTSRVGTATKSSVTQTKVNAGMKIAGYTVGAITAIATENYAALALLAISAFTDGAGSAYDYNTSARREREAYGVISARYSTVNRSR